MHYHGVYLYIVMGAMKMGNIVPRVGLKPTSLAFRDSVPPLHNIGSLMSPLYPCLPVYAVPCLRGRCRLLHIHIHLESKPERRMS